MNYRDDLKAFVDGELPPLRMAEIQDAIDRDPALAAEVEEIRGIGYLFTQMREDVVPVGLEETLARLQKRPARRWSFGVPLAVAAASVAVVILIGPLRSKFSEADSATLALKARSDFSSTAPEAAPMSAAPPEVAVAPSVVKTAPKAETLSMKSQSTTRSDSSANSAVPATKGLSRDVPNTTTYLRAPASAQLPSLKAKKEVVVKAATDEANVERLPYSKASASVVSPSPSLNPPTPEAEVVSVVSMVDAEQLIRSLPSKYPGVVVGSTAPLADIPLSDQHRLGMNSRYVIEVPERWANAVQSDLDGLAHPIPKGNETLSANEGGGGRDTAASLSASAKRGMTSSEPKASQTDNVGFGRGTRTGSGAMAGVAAGAGGFGGGAPVDPPQKVDSANSRATSPKTLGKTAPMSSRKNPVVDAEKLARQSHLAGEKANLSGQKTVELRRRRVIVLQEIAKNSTAKPDGKE